MPPGQGGRARGALGRVARGVLLLALLCFACLFGRPLYWGVVARLEPDGDNAGEGGTEEEALMGTSTTRAAAVSGIAVRPQNLPSPSSSASPSPTSSSASPSSSSPTSQSSRDSASVSASEPLSPALPSTANASSTGAASSSQKGEEFGKGVRAIVHEGRPLLAALKGPIWQRPAEGTPFPGKAEFALRREMVAYRAAADGLVLVTFANFAFMDFVLNWVQHLTEQGVVNILVGAMDQKLLEALFYRGVPVFDMESGIQAEDAAWGSPVFHKMGREKVTLVNAFLALGYHLLICDTDAVMLRDPLPYVRRFPDADILMSSDHLSRTVEDDDLEDNDQSHGAYNIGILLFRPTNASRRFARRWAEKLAGDDSIWDQNGFNDEMRLKMGPKVPGASSKNLFWAFDGTLKAGILPVSIFCSGHTYFIQRLYSVVRIQPYAIHTTFQFSGADGKRHRLREAQHFRDPAAYYDPPNGLVSFSAKVPTALLTGGNHTLQTHFELMNYQLRQLRVMMAIAMLLNRTLVFPQIWARYDSEYFPHAGIVELTDTAQPLIVPLDHLFQVDKMLPGVLEESDMGPGFSFREYSFLDNPMVPREVKESKLSVSLCRDRKRAPFRVPVPATASSGDGSSTGFATAKSSGSPAWARARAARADKAAKRLLPCSTRLSSPKELLLPQGISTGELLSALAPYKDKKWIEFETSVEFLIGSWDDQELQSKFYRRLRNTVAAWCCVYAHPGHIYYDVFADEKPGWKPKPPATPAEDHPPWD